MNVISRSPEDPHGNFKSRLENKDGEIVQQHSEDHEWKSPPPIPEKTWADIKKDVKIFLWNPETREFMGRTADSWGRILLYYLVFYSFLAGLFALCMHVMLLTLSPYTPKYRDRVAPPGVMIRPHVNKILEINFSFGNPQSWKPYVNNLEQFLGAYNDSVQERKNAVCTPGSYFIQDTEESTMKRACQFKRSLLKNCSGLEDQTFGYSRGHPCILLKMNRIIGYRPGYGTPVTVSCKGRKDDMSNVLAVDFYPSSTFDPMYFPYYGKRTHENYTSPLVAMQFTLKMNQTVSIQCQLDGVGIINDALDLFLGRIIFDMTVQP